MALNLACRRLRFHRDFLQPFSRGAHHLSRSFSNTAQASKPEWWFKKNAKFLALQRGLGSEIGQGTTGPRGIKFLTEGERLAVLETVSTKSHSLQHTLTRSKKEHSFLKGSIMDGIKSNKNQIEGLYWLGWIVAVFGFGVVSCSIHSGFWSCPAHIVTSTAI